MVKHSNQAQATRQRGCKPFGELHLVSTWLDVDAVTKMTADRQNHHPTVLIHFGLLIRFV